MRGIALALLLAATPALADESKLLGYPGGYRQWMHVKTMVIRSGHPLHHLFGGVYHIYANKPALDGYRKGKFGNGATLVLDLLEARDDGYSVSEGPRKLVAMMQKDAKKYPQTGGWGFEAWRGDNRKERIVGDDARRACFECHASQQKNDYVFSTYRFKTGSAPDASARKKK
jgi:hypothetical protein